MSQPFGKINTVEAPRFADQQRKQRDILRDALTKHGHVIIHPEALTQLPTLRNAAELTGAHIKTNAHGQLELTR